MANKIAINRVANANVYVEGSNFLGRANKVKLPTVKEVMEDHKGLGMRAKLSVPSGGIELSEAEIEWASFYAEVLAKIKGATSSLNLQVRASIEAYTSAGKASEVALVANMSGIFTERDFGTFEQQKPVTLPMKFTPYFFELIVDGDSVIKVDVFNNIHEEAGEDLLSRFRAIIGG